MESRKTKWSTRKVKMSFPVIFKLPNDDNALKTDSLIESIEE